MYFLHVKKIWGPFRIGGPVRWHLLHTFRAGSALHLTVLHFNQQVFFSPGRIQCLICQRFGHSAIDYFNRLNMSYEGRVPSSRLQAYVVAPLFSCICLCSFCSTMALWFWCELSHNQGRGTTPKCSWVSWNWPNSWCAWWSKFANIQNWWLLSSN